MLIFILLQLSKMHGAGRGKFEVVESQIDYVKFEM